MQQNKLDQNIVNSYKEYQESFSSRGELFGSSLARSNYLKLEQKTRLKAVQEEIKREISSPQIEIYRLNICGDSPQTPQTDYHSYMTTEATPDELHKDMFVSMAWIDIYDHSN
jgi:hypothetical protein